MQESDEHGDSQSASLGFWDTVNIIVGIVVGVSIFKAPPEVFSSMSTATSALGLWAAGGGLSLIGAMCYAELATTYPRSGGGYVYLSRAFGPWLGFLFGWAQLVAILSGSIGALAYVFGDYGAALFELSADRAVLFALAAVGGLTLMNLCGVVFGKVTQNVLTVAKIVGLVAVMIAGIGWGQAADDWDVEHPVGRAGLGYAMIMVLYAYGGWNDAARVTAEIRDRRRNIPLALIVGTLAITAVYLIVNMAYLTGLGFLGARSSVVPAADVLQLAWGGLGASAVSVLIMISALGAINGMIFTGSRIYASMGVDHHIFAWLGSWSPRFGVPVHSLLAQGGVTIVLIFAVGTATGRDFVDRLFSPLGFGALPWQDYHGGFETLVAATAPVFWAFFLLTGISLFVLRVKDRGIERPYTVPLYPVTPTIFCLTSAYMLYASIDYAGRLGLLGILPVLMGVGIYVIGSSSKRDRSRRGA